MFILSKLEDTVRIAPQVGECTSNVYVFDSACPAMHAPRWLSPPLLLWRAAAARACAANHSCGCIIPLLLRHAGPGQAR